MKNKKETLKKGIIALLFSQVLIKILGFVYKLYLTNRENFGDTGNAVYSAGFQIYALLLTFSSTGVPNAISKLVSERLAIGDSKGAHRIFKIAFYTFAFFGLIGTIILFLGAKTISKTFLEIPEAEYCLVALSPSIFFVSIASVLRGYFNGRENFSLTAKSQTIEQLVKTIATIILVEIVARLSKENIVLMAWVANLATTVATFISFSYIYIYYRYKRKEIAREIKMSINYVPTRVRKTLRKILNESIPISLSSLMSSFNKNIDLFTIVKILKTYMSEEEAKMQYGILSGKVDTICLLPLSFNTPFVTAMVPSISKAMAKGDMKEVSIKIAKFIQITFFIALPSMLILFFFSDSILNLLFPNAREGNDLLQINSISIIFALLAQTLNAILQGIGKKNIPAMAFFIGMLFKFFTNIILIKVENIGIKGAAIGNIICNMVVCIIDLKPIIELKIISIFDIFKIKLKK